MIPAKKKWCMICNEVHTEGLHKDSLEEIKSSGSRLSQEEFNRISDLRMYLLLHPDHEMILESCLHYLGDGAQKWWENREKSKTGEIFEYKEKRYRIFKESKMKIDGVWNSCVIYQALYENSEGEFFVRESEEFFNLFKRAN